MLNLKRIGSLLTIIAITAGCATTIPDPNKPLEKYTAIGRAALKAPENSGQASFNWEQKTPEELKLIVQGPLGSGRIDLAVAPNESVLKTEEKTYTGKSPDELFTEITGFDWPISGMQNWLVGTPNAKATNIERDDKNRIIAFKEDGWNIQYKKWTNYKKRDIPQSIELTRGDVRLRLLVEHWLY